MTNPLERIRELGGGIGPRQSNVGAPLRAGDYVAGKLTEMGYLVASVVRFSPCNHATWRRREGAPNWPLRRPPS